MADLISSNDEQQEMAKQVEAIAEAAAQRDSQIAQMLNLVPKAAALSTAASRAINFTKKTWVDDPTSGTPITAADMNRLEQAIVDLNTTLTSVQNSVSHQPKVIIGTDIWSVTAGSDKLALWTRDQFVDRFGVVFNNSRDCFSVMNGDAVAQGNARVTGCWYESGTIGCYLSGHNTGAIRINYAIFLH